MDFKGIVYGGQKFDVTDQGVRDMITDAFSEEKSYTAGDLCIRNNTLYRFTSNKVSGAWDDTVVQQTSLEALYGELNSKTIVDSGANANGYYRKYADGTMECWTRTTADIAIDTVYGLGWYNGYYTWTFPEPFIDDSAVVTCSHFRTSSNASLPGISVVNKKVASLFVLDATKRELNTYDISIRAIGRWK